MILKLLSLLSLLLWAGPAAAHLYTFESTLLGTNTVPPTTTSLNGTATMIYDSDTDTFSMTASFEGVTIANYQLNGFHVHLGSPGENGIVLVGLPLHGEMITLGDGTITGFTGTDIPMLTQYESDLLEGRTYLMLHAGPDSQGGIRGPLVLTETVPTESDTWSDLKFRFLAP